MNEALYAQLDRLANMKGVETALAAAEVIAEKASELAPRRTGYLAEHIHAERYGDVVQVVSEAPYSIYVEFGTVYMEAQPFLRPAMDEYEREISQAVKQAADEELRRIV
jgi:HK97 gp10 family phage protein